MNNFILTNDPDHETLAIIKPIFKAFNESGIKITTSVFCKMEDDGSDLSRHCWKGETDTLENPKYRDFILEQKEKGHEIAFHGYSQVSNTREKFLEGLEIYKDVFGEYPFTYIEHGGKYGHHKDSECKKETLIWKGSDKNSEYYVKDVIKEKIKYTWAYHDLIEKSEPDACNHEDYFYTKNELSHFRRYKIHQASLVKNTGQVFIGYTHFGYRGYFHEHHDWEYWADNRYSSPISNILKFLNENSFESTTVKDYLNA